MTNKERDYVLYILESSNLLSCIVSGKKFILDKFDNIDHSKLNKLILRYLKRVPLKKPFAKGHTFLLDGSSQVSYKETNNILHICLSTLNKGKKLVLPLTSNAIRFSGDIRIVLKDDLKGHKCVEIHKYTDVKRVKNSNTNIVAVSIGLNENLFTTNTGNKYGTIKFYKLLQDSYVKDIIYKSIKSLIKNEHPKILIFKDFNKKFVNQCYKRFNIRTEEINNLKKFLQEIILYKCSINNIEAKFINPIYTDYSCNSCGSIDTQFTNNTIKCKKCSLCIDKDYNNALNIMC